MPYLKHEMRNNNNSQFEEGLLEKILNLAFASLMPYSGKLWEITAVGSPVQLQKLLKATGERKITECAYALIIFDNSGTEYDTAAKWSISHEIDMLSLSIGYAAKFYCVDCFILKNPDNQAVIREFYTGRKNRAVEIICLGFFKDRLLSQNGTPAKNIFSEAVRVV